MSKDLGGHVTELTSNCRELKDHELELVSGGRTTYTHQKPAGSAGNVGAQWNLGAAA